MTELAFDTLTPVFILSIPRSGTTLVQSLLDGHPQLIIDVADSHFYKYYQRANKLTFDQQIEFAELHMISHIFNEKSQYYKDYLAHISIVEFKQAFRTRARQLGGTPKDFMESYYWALGEISGTLQEQTRGWVRQDIVARIFA